MDSALLREADKVRNLRFASIMRDIAEDQSQCGGDLAGRNRAAIRRGSVVLLIEI